MALQPIPSVNEDTAAFWEGGATSQLMIHRCRTCRAWFHPPAPVCAECLSLDVGPEAASGKATVVAYSVNYQPWAPDMVVPYVVGYVLLDDAAPVQLTTRFVDVAPEDMAVGMPVEVVFEQHEDVYLQLFRPVATGTTAKDQA
jgi:uncharacterized protein